MVIYTQITYMSIIPCACNLSKIGLFSDNYILYTYLCFRTFLMWGCVCVCWHFRAQVVLISAFSRGHKMGASNWVPFEIRFHSVLWVCVCLVPFCRRPRQTITLYRVFRCDATSTTNAIISPFGVSLCSAKPTLCKCEKGLLFR